KTEVKFASDKRVFDAVYYAVQSSLEGEHAHPQAVLSSPKSADTVTPNQMNFGKMTAAEYRGGNLPLHDYTHPKPPAPRPTDPVKISPRVEPPEKIAPATIRPPEPVSAPTPIAPPSPAPIVDETPWRILGEAMNTYIIVEQGEKLLFIDKHAAHERVNFDRLKAAGYKPMVQNLLAPIAFTPAPEESAVLLQQLPLLAEFGFEAEDFGGGALIVRAAPYDVDPGDIEETLTALASRLLTAGSANPAAARDELLHTMACKAAIKGGQKNSPDELEAVAAAVLRGDVKYCPHGRPVAIELTKAQLEKQFKRA
ncbi:MAG: DNA mismatch repair protein MutL, partial [Pseudoflavonifractor sp.]